MNYTGMETNSDPSVILRVVEEEAGFNLGFRARGYFKIVETTPAPTVLPPSRIAKRIPFSTAIG